MILDGKIAAEYLFKNLLSQIDSGNIPKLVAIQVGNNPASSAYIRLKQKKLLELGLGFEHCHLDENITQDELEKTIEKYNNDDSITGILLQLPLPEHLDKQKLLDLISPRKDPDCLTSYNLGQFFVGNSNLIPATPLGVIRLLEFYEIPVEQKNICIVGRSNLVGKPLAIALTNLNATVTLCHSKTKDLHHFTKKADIVIVAIGKAKFLNQDFFSENQTVVDVGINKISEGLVGDVDFNEVKHLVQNITPVPGGVGPMTIYGLIENLVNLNKVN